MRINRIKLTGFKRIALTGYRNIEIDFTRKIQLILGMNSSGKSSLMNELSPLPISNSDLFPDGGKEIWIEHNGHEYYLANWKGGKCSLIRLTDNEELNPGGTQAVQKELVQQIFGYNATIHKLLIGAELFTEMRPNQRKEWITELSDVSYDYALKVFASLKERLRDSQGALKVARKKLVEALDARIESTEEDTLRRELSEWERRLEALNEMRQPLEHTPVRLEEAREYMTTLYRRLRSLLRSHYLVLQKEQRSEIIVTESLLKSLSDRRQALFNDLDKNEKRLYDMRNLGISNTSELVDKLKSLESIMNETRAKKQLDYTTDNPAAALQSLESILSEVEELMFKLPSNLDEFYSKQKLARYTERKIQLQDTVAKIDNQITKLEAVIKHSEEHRDSNAIDCPQCQHRFSPHFNQEELENRQAHLVSLREQRVRIMEDLANVKLDLETQETYYQIFNDFSVIARANPILGFVWQHLVSTKLVSQYPKQVPNLLRRFIFDLKVDLEVLSLEKEYAKLKDSLNQQSEGDNLSIAYLEERIEEVKNELADIMDEYERVKKQLDRLQEDLRIRQQIESLSTRLKEAETQYNQSFDYSILQSFQQGLLDSIRTVQIRIGECADRLSNIKANEAVIRNMEQNIQRLEAEEKTYKALVTELSPTDGLIASGLMEFIRHLVSQMNELINSVWSYSFNIVPPSFSEDGSAELDYRFPFIMVSESNTVSDISLGSKGQQEIINLAFRIVACKYLHLLDVPIFADEFGTGLDETHRKRAAHAIKTIVSESSYSQLFMISHYEDAHGSLTNAEVCVLSEDNITVPQEYNTHVVFS